MADTKKAVSVLHDALTEFREECGKDPDCKSILVGVDATEREIEKVYPAEEKRERPDEPDEPESEYARERSRPRERQSSTLRGATSYVREQMAARRRAT